MELSWYVDEVTSFRNRAWVRGWLYRPAPPITSVELVLPGEAGQPVLERSLPSPDAARRHGDDASTSGFAADVRLPAGRYPDELTLHVTLADNRVVVLEDLHGPATDRDPYHALERSFRSRLDRTPGDVLEIGSRDRSGAVRRDLVEHGRRYVGLDIVAGPNVDVVGDAHDLAQHFPPGAFGAVFAVATFEHLLMPWKAVLEINRVLRPGGLLWIATHQTFPLHEVPWDFWRFSNDGWRGVLNPATGFSILEVAMGEPASVVPLRSHRVVRDMDRGQAFLGAGVLAEKIADTALRWPVAVDAVIDSRYPA